MDTSGIPEPTVKGRDEAAARELLELCLAHAGAPDDADVERALTAAEHKMRKGPVLRAGEILDRRFRLLSPSVQGSLSATWRAFDLQQRALVSIEILHPQHIADPFLVARFREGPALAQAHAGPELAAVVEPDGEWEGFPYAALDMPGEPLAARLGTLDPRDRRGILLELCEIVGRLHLAGVVHGALSPDTVRLGEHDRVVLGGLGLYGPGNRGTFAAPEEANPSYVATSAADVHLVALVALAVLRDAPVPYWVGREPERVLAELQEGPEIVDLLRRMLHWRAEERPSIAEVGTVLLGDVEHQLALARRAAERGRAALAVTRFEAVQGARSVGRAVRRELALALSAAGRKAEAAHALADALTDPGLPPDAVDSGLVTLRELAAITGDADPLVRTLEVLSAEGRPGRAAALVELARFRDAEGEPSTAAWEAALGAHRTRAQAKEALERLLALARESSEPRSTVRWGRELHPYLDDPSEAAALALALGRTFLDALEDPDNGLLWLDRALAAGADDPELPTLLRTLRTVRGDWTQIVDLLEEEAGRAGGAEAVVHLRNAAATARFALADADRAAALHAQVLARDPSDADALRFAARRDFDAGRHEDAARALALLRDPRPADACRRIDGWMAAGRLDQAVSAFEEERESWPDHVGVLQRGMLLLLHTGDEGGLTEVASALADRLGPGAPGRRDALLVLAHAARVDGELAEAARVAREVLDDDPQDGAAWWVLVQIAWAAARTEAEPAWLRAAPRYLPAQEALARLIGGLLDPGAVLGWLMISEGIVPAVGASRLEHAATVVDRLVRHGLVGHELFDRLAAVAPDNHGWIEAVRLLWEGTRRADVAFPVALAHAWCPIEGPDLFRGTHRLPIGPGPQGPTRPPGALASDHSFETLLLRDEAMVVSDEREATPGGIDRQRRPAARIGADDPRAIERRLQVSRGAWLEARGSAVYLVSEAAVEVGGMSLTETRLADGAVVEVGGVRVEYLPDLPILALPDDDEEDGDLDEEEPSIEDQSTPESFEYAVSDEETETAPLPDDVRAALFFREAGSERILPLTDAKTVIHAAADGQIQIGSGGDDSGEAWLARIVHPEIGRYLLEIRGEVGPGGPGSPRLLSDRDRFTVGGVAFEFQLIVSVTPAPAPPRAVVEDDQIAVFVLDDDLPTPQILPLRDGFTIGRGRRNDLQLAADGRLSRVHCTVLFGADRSVVVRDNNSSNGTLVNGELVAEHTLVQGDKVSIGDTDLIFRWMPRRGLVAPSPDLGENDLASEELELEGMEDPNSDVTGPFTALLATAATAPLGRRTGTVTVEDGKAKLQAANAALAAVVLSLDKAFGSGRGRAELQNMVDASPRRFTALFEGVDARATGLPEMVVLYNVAQRPEGSQRSLLNEALADLVDRVVAGALEALPPDEVDPLLERLSVTRYREALRL